MVSFVCPGMDRTSSDVSSDIPLLWAHIAYPDLNALVITCAQLSAPCGSSTSTPSQLLCLSIWTMRSPSLLPAHLDCAVHDMFWPQPWDNDAAFKGCQEMFNVTPRPLWATVQYVPPPPPHSPLRRKAEGSPINNMKPGVAFPGA